MPAIPKPTIKRLAGLVLLSLLFSLLYLFWDWTELPDFLWLLRQQKLFSYTLVAIATAFATISFQTVTGNRLLSPNLLGLESLFVLIQTATIFFSHSLLAQQLGPLAEFGVSLGIQLLFFLLLQPVLNRFLEQDLILILLTCMALGTLFRSLSIFLQVLLDPNEFDQLQAKLLPSFQRINLPVLGLAAVLIVLASIYLLKKASLLDLLALDLETAGLLGVQTQLVQKQVLWAVVLLVASSTALVGPLLFFGFLVSNLSYLFLSDYHHSWLFPIASLIGFCLLVFSQFLSEQVFQLQIPSNQLIEVIGGSLFFYLVYKENTKHD
ncbi:iron chelate uptake ABC transporter family permease subunit [Streptococcus danieliae]|uniref:Iron chelate uptake ABC transporter family permease subunit n=1 Tax=Streptococcus danieliae TaxID=747656 RepID=A0A7X3G8U3_9STRE|nr:iron chelate uptake ABC transporter family permease subunit [Streptococcus danieliae]MVX59135.1 iron chelate uptake ABC transporter family permease subunit [Streptococcus danieliae]